MSPLRQMSEIQEIHRKSLKKAQTPRGNQHLKDKIKQSQKKMLESGGKKKKNSFLIRSYE
jgi:hypothetical protein